MGLFHPHAVDFFIISAHDVRVDWKDAADACTDLTIVMTNAVN